MPDDTEIVILLENHDGTPKFSLVPVNAYRKLINANRAVLARTPRDSRHTVVTPAEAEEWLDNWHTATTSIGGTVVRVPVKGARLLPPQRLPIAPHSGHGTVSSPRTQPGARSK